MFRSKDLIHHNVIGTDIQGSFPEVNWTGYWIVWVETGDVQHRVFLADPKTHLSCQEGARFDDAGNLLGTSGQPVRENGERVEEVGSALLN